MSGRDAILALDTATSRTTLAVSGVGGRSPDVRSWPSAGRPAQHVLDGLAELLGGRPGRDDLGGVVAGTGPGGFTGLRVGLATAKTLAYALGVPIVGIPTALALAEAARAVAGPDELLVVQPAGPTERYCSLVRLVGDQPTIVDGPRLASSAQGVPPETARLVAVDLPAGEAADDAVRLGAVALDGLGAALLTLGSRALAAGRTDDVAGLVPIYVTLPRGVSPATAELAWSPDLR